MEGIAAKGLAVLTCIDSRIDPLAMLGLRAGDAKIIRNAGARVTDDALRSLILAVNLLGVTRVCVVQHTNIRCPQRRARPHQRVSALWVGCGRNYLLASTSRADAAAMSLARWRRRPGPEAAIWHDQG